MSRSAPDRGLLEGDRLVGSGPSLPWDSEDRRTGTVPGNIAMLSFAGALRLGGFVTVPRLVTPGSHFLRTVILSRLLSPHDLGIAIALTVVLSVAELISDFGLDRYLISRGGAQDAEALAAAHGLQLIRGVVLAVLIWLMAPVVAQLFGATEHGAQFRWCALILVIRDLAHLGIRQKQRELQYRPEAAAILIARIGALLAVYPAAVEFGDFRAMIVSLLVDAVLYTVASHALADTSYRVVTRDRRIWCDALEYSLPLTLNGIGLAANSQADRALVSHWLGVGVLALYALVLNLAVVPAGIILGVLNIVSVAVLAQRADEHTGNVRYGAVAWGHAVTALAYALLVSTTLQVLAPSVFGAAYAVGAWSVTLISWILTIRIVRGAPTALLLAQSKTGQLMAANLSSVAGLALACLLLPFEPRVETMLVCVLVGDTISLGLILVLVRSVGRGCRPLADRQSQSAAALAILSPLLLQIALGSDQTERFVVGFAGIVAIGVYAAFGARQYLGKEGLAAALSSQGR